MTPEQRIALRQIESWRQARLRGRPAEEIERRLLLVDATAFFPLPPEEAVWSGSPLARLLAAAADGDRESAPALVFVATEAEDAALLDTRLRGAGREPRLARADDAALGLTVGEVVVVGGGAAAVVEGALTTLDPEWRVLAWLSPAAPADLPARALHTLAARPGTELLCRLPLEELRRLERHGATPVADLPVAVRRFAQGVSAMLDDPRFEWLGAWRATLASSGLAAAREVVAERCVARLAAAAAPALHRWSVPGGAPGGSGSLDWVVATPVPERALAVNRILHDLRAEGLLPWTEPTDPAVRLEDPGVIDLFGAGVPGGGRIRVVDLPALAERVAAALDGGAATLADVMRRLLGPDLHPEDVRAALRLLKLGRRVGFRSLADPDAPLRPGDPEDGSPPSGGPGGRRPGGTPTLWG